MSPLWLRLPSPCLWTGVLWKLSPPLKLCRTGRGAETVVTVSLKERHIYVKSLKNRLDICIHVSHVYSQRPKPGLIRPPPTSRRRPARLPALRSHIQLNCERLEEERNTTLSPKRYSWGLGRDPVFTHSQHWRNAVPLVFRWSGLSSVWLVGGGQSSERSASAARIVGWWPTQSAATAAPRPAIPSLLALPWGRQRCKSEWCIFSAPSASIINSVEI